MRSGQKLKSRKNREHSSQTKAVNFLKNVILTEKIHLERTHIEKMI